MKFFINIEKSLKSGLNIDFFIKSIFFFLYKNLVGNNYIYIIDKYLVEKLFFMVSTFINYISLFLNSIRLLNFKKIIQLSLIICIQLIIVFIV